ncbi:ROK family protein [Microbacterium sp. 22303]|uniref:ROK family protein n=1 Tax=Microbacterium sp. 22303 TaxID=3453905 RepID=UPI003F82E39C
MHTRAGSKRLIREINEALILDLVRAEEPVARSVIATQTGLSAATVTGITGRLIEAGLLIESETQPSTGGRPARLLSLGSNTIFAVGLRISRDSVHAALVDLRGHVVADRTVPLPSPGPEEVAAGCASAVAAVARAATGRVLGVGAAISGIVDRDAGVVRHSGALGWEDVPFAAILAALVDVPVVVDNYVNSYTRELLSAEKELADRELLVCSIGVSLGSALVSGGRIHRGRDGTAGSIAHMRLVIDPASSRPCHCGATDCLEAWASRWGLEQEAARQGLTWDLLALGRGAGAGIIDAASAQLALGIASAAKSFGADTVILAETGEYALPDLVRSTAEQLRAEYLHEPYPAPRIHRQEVDDTAVAKGAASQVLDTLFTIH